LLLNEYAEKLEFDYNKKMPVAGNDISERISCAIEGVYRKKLANSACIPLARNLVKRSAWGKNKKEPPGGGSFSNGQRLLVASD
jgi:hypothetical protein